MTTASNAQSTAIFTSITLSYLAKARVLAESVRRFAPGARMCLVLAEPAPADLAAGVADGREPFDEILTDSDLDIPDHDAWMYGHEIVEACTGLKAFALKKLLAQHEKVVYLDPDVLVLGSLDPILSGLDEHDILLTPHCPDAETDLDAIIFNEISSLAHGTFNLGFLAIANRPEGQRFADWWKLRLHHFCHDDIPRGLFTDQRWVDLVPGQFRNVGILRDPGMNAASWNLTHRRVTGSVPDDLRVNDQRLVFYHFSGANAGVPERMYRQLNIADSAVPELVEHYRARCEAMGESVQKTASWHYSAYRDGQPITPAQRRYYRDQPEFRSRFPDPFDTGPGSYRDWLESDGPGLQGIEELFSDAPESTRGALLRLRRIEANAGFRLLLRLRRSVRSMARAR